MNSQLFTNITEKLQQAARQNINERRRQRQETQTQMAHIQETLNQRRLREQQDISQAKDHMQQMEQLVEQNIRTMTLTTNKQIQKTAALKEELQTRVQCAQRDHQEEVQTILDKQDQKITSISEEFDKKSKNQKERMESTLNSLSKKLINLQKDFKEQSENRKLGVDRIRLRFYEELEQIKEVIEKEKDRRVSAERKIDAMVQQIEEKLDQEISNQSIKRKRNNQAMLKLIELACQKIEERTRQ